mmetsp:Transcript_65335/g.90913  ORF Transcript_65335/g.90913 Transcript_65335/m.90913 type:complete len:249 (+) Transcript_65335:118-864(+)
MGSGRLDARLWRGGNLGGRGCGDRRGCSGLPPLNLHLLRGRLGHLFIAATLRASRSFACGHGEGPRARRAHVLPFPGLLSGRRGPDPGEGRRLPELAEALGSSAHAPLHPDLCCLSLPFPNAAGGGVSFALGALHRLLCRVLEHFPALEQLPEKKEREHLGASSSQPDAPGILRHQPHVQLCLRDARVLARPGLRAPPDLPDADQYPGFRLHAEPRVVREDRSDRCQVRQHPLGGMLTREVCMCQVWI